MSRKRGTATPPRKWQPMARAERIGLTPEKEAAIREAGGDDALIAELAAAEVWKNDRYTVMVARHTDGWVMELSIRRNDRKPAHDWRDFQRIKSEIAGPDVEAIELYPAESRLMDTANQYYLWCLPPGERIHAGFDNGRNLKDPHEVAAVGAVQRPLPDDWKEYPA